MKSRVYGMALSLFFALGLVFSFGIDASSHDGSHSNQPVNAADVEIGDEAQVQAFLTHMSTHLKEIVDTYSDTNEQSRHLLLFTRETREEGIWNDGDDMYVIGINEKGTITNHAGYPGLYGHSFDIASGTLKELFEATEDSPACANYTYDGEDRVACAIKTETVGGTVATVVGYHHDERDAMDPVCTDLTLSTEATEVESEDNLRDYVQSVISTSKTLLTSIGTKVAGENPNLLPGALAGDPEATAELGRLTNQELFGKVACFGNEDSSNGPVFKHDDIYIFIMAASPDATVLFNGQNPQLNGLDLQVEDPNPNPADGETNKNIAELIREALEPIEDEASATVQYHWLKPGDDPTDDWFEMKVVPGDSHKISYVEVANLNTSGFGPPAIFIFGSGIYPSDTMDDDTMDDDTPASVSSSDGGCAIAEADNASQGALLNLLLTTSVLFSAVFLRRRV